MSLHKINQVKDKASGRFVLRLELVEEIGQLLDKEGIGFSQALKVLGIAIVVRKAVTI